jgi:uncharacterized membrane protein YdjX (TVP38/TMEM64 family)
MTPRRRKLLILALPALAAAGLLLLLALGDLVSIAELKARRSELQALIGTRPVLHTAAFILLFAVAAAFAPGAAIFKVAAGALFGLAGGFAASLLATWLAALIGFFTSRYLARHRVERRFAAQIDAINRGVSSDGAVYLLAMRFNPIVPFFLINFGMGLTRMRWWVFAAASLVGLMPASFVYSNAGTQLARIETPSDILSVPLLASLVLLSAMPLAGRFAASWLRRRRGVIVDLPADR